MSYPRHERTDDIRRMLMDMAPIKFITMELGVNYRHIHHQVQEMELERVYVTPEEKELLQKNRKKILQAGHQW